MKRIFILISLLIITLSFLFFHFFRITYLSHLIIEFLCIFIQLSIFLILLILPKYRITFFMETLGISNLLSATIDIFHALTFPGGPQGVSNINYSISLWMFARAIQSSGFLFSSFYYNSEKKFKRAYFYQLLHLFL